MIFDRVLSYGTHLDIPAGTAVRFEPGERKTVSLVQVGGSRLLSGGSGLGSGQFTEQKRGNIEEVVIRNGFGHRKQEVVEEASVPEMDREVVCLIVDLLADRISVCLDVWTDYGR